ncbi:MAG: efflux RND transporter periplasmic adaptor subunit [Ignavibacteria bacterium]
MKTKDVDLSSLKIDRSKKEHSYTGGNKFFGIFFFVLIIAALFFGGYYGWQILFAKGEEVALTTVSLVSPSQSNALLTASGYVVAQRKASVASKATGRLVYLGVVEGDAVKKDQVIGRLESDDVRAQLNEVKASLKLYEADLIDAESNYKRIKELYEAGVSPEKDFKTAESVYKRILASIELTKAQIKSAEITVEYTLIRAPFDGTVLTKNADVGEIVSPLGASATSRAAIVTMADMSSLQVETDVSESNIDKIEPEQDCEITLDAYPQIRYAGYVDKVVPTADRSKATVLVKVAFKNYDSRVLPEMSAKVLFLNAPVDTTMLNQKPKLMVLKSAIVRRNSKTVAFKLRDKKAIEVEVIAGNESGDLIEIISGLNNGDKVIKSVTENIRDGAKVQIK